MFVVYLSSIHSVPMMWTGGHVVWMRMCVCVTQREREGGSGGVRVKTTRRHLSQEIPGCSTCSRNLIASRSDEWFGHGVSAKSKRAFSYV